MNSTTAAVILASALALAASSCFAAKTALGDPPAGHAQKTGNPATKDFATADRDNNGMLDKTEAKAMTGVAVHFETIDTDRNGKVSQDEIQVYERFSNKDQNADGTLDRNEAKGWWIVSRNFDAINTDSGAAVSLAEINAYISARKLHFANAK
jgi:Ca2+-binding EF-hand superfamily protein